MRAKSSAESIPMVEGEAQPCPELPGLRVVRRNGVRLVEQIWRGIEALVEQGRLRAGTRVPSVRDLSRALGVSTFTVVEAYEVLAARRLFSARRGSGYFVMHRGARPPDPPRAPVPPSIGDTWLTIPLFAQHRNIVPAGCGWLPAKWCGESSITEALRQAARIPNERLAGYGSPLGFLPLRQHLAERLSEKLTPVSPDQLVLTNGASHALDLVVRTLLSPGDPVLVESPGYSNLFPMLRERGCRLLPVPRTRQGLCLDTLQLLAAEHRPKVMFVHTALQNPLSTSLTPIDAYRLLAAAERFDFTLVEDDIFRDFCATSEPSLAAMDGLQKRVLNIGSFSKAISPSLRVGYVAAPEAHVNRLQRMKMVSGLTTSEINERIVHEVVSNPSHRRYLERLRSRLDAGRERLLASLESLGLEPLAVPDGGMFISAGWRTAPTATVNARVIADAALQAQIALAPGEFFQVGEPQSIWFRFNVAYADDPRLHAFLRGVPDRFAL